MYCHQPECFDAIGKCYCNQITYSQTIKHVGVFLDSDNKYKTHVNHIAHILRITLYKFYKLANVLPIKTKRVLYYSLVESILRYEIILYSNTSDSTLKPLREIQTRIIKVLLTILILP